MFKFLYQNCMFIIKLDIKKTAIIKNAMFTSRWFSIQTDDNLAKWAEFKSKFSEIQLTQILNILNKRNIDKMRECGIPERDIEVFAKLPTDNKIHESLENFLTYDSININLLERICSTIILSNNKTPKSFKKKPVVSPPIKAEILRNLKTAVGLQIGPNYISWSHLELTGSNCNILKWDCQNLSNLSLKANCFDVIKVAIDIAKDIPDADAYIMEKDSFKAKSQINMSLLPLLFRKQQLTSAIITSLFTRSKFDGTINDSSKTFYTMQPFVPANLFKLYVGSEIVTANKVVQSILDNKNNNLKYIQSVTIDNETAYTYNNYNAFKKEELNKSLLLTLAFFELAVLK